MSVEITNFGGRYSARQILLQALEAVDDIEFVVLAVKFRGGSFSAGWSEGEPLAKLGLCEVLKARLLEGLEKDAPPEDGA